MKIAVIIPAAGFSARYSQGLDFPRSKLDEEIGGRTILQRSVELFTKAESPDWTVGAIIVAGPHDPEAMTQFKARHGDKLSIMGVKLVSGGKTHRWETVKAALAEVPADCTHIAVHDAARPCTPPELIDRLFDTAAKYAAVIPGIEVPDTLKRTTEIDRPAEDKDPLAAILGDGPGSQKNRKLRIVESTLDRARVFSIQTPQVFESALLREAYEQKDLTSTDDAALVERLLAGAHPDRKGGASSGVVVIDGDTRNLKITRPADVRMARSILGIGPPQERPVHKRF